MATSGQGDSMETIARSLQSLKLLMIFFGIIISVLLVIITIRSFTTNLAPSQPPPGPPIIVRGGSIDGHSPKGWSSVFSCDSSVVDPAEYCAAIPNGYSYVLSSTGFNSAVSPAIGNTQSWTILITDMTSDGKPNSNEGILLCDNAACNPASPHPDLQHVYIKPYDEQGSEWEGKPSPDLHIRDKSDHCGDSYDASKHGGKCEHPSTAILSVGDPHNTTTYTCVQPYVPDYCKIEVGVTVPQ